ncbi:MAG: hypothetical protein SFY32_16245, partial [Bacteroidota bacterium]|nr:hypothetical protein [Bacteroidota bacterium]
MKTNLTKILFFAQLIPFYIYSQCNSVINNSGSTVVGQYVSSYINIDGYLTEPDWNLLAGYVSVNTTLT